MRGWPRPIAALAAVILFAAACGDDGESGGATEAPDPSGATSGDSDDTDSSGDGETCSEERKGGELTVGVGSGLALGIDPTVALGTGCCGAIELTAVYDTLMRYNPEAGEIEPYLAEGLEPNDDLTQWTLRLPSGVEFGNGDPVTAEAVRFSVERLAAATVAPSGMAQEVESMEVVDDLTIVFNLRQPWGTFPYFLAAEGGMIVNPRVVEAKGENFANDPVGAGVGPYEIERFAPGEEVVLRAKEEYWGGPVCIETLRFVWVPGGQATYDAFRAGELDVMFLTEAQPIADAIDDGVANRNVVNGGTGYLLNSGRGSSPVLADQRLRLAIAHALDTEVLDERVFGGVGLPATGLVHPDQRIYPGLDGPEYDPDRARELVEEAKADGFDGNVRITCDDTPTQVEQTITTEAMLESVGFTVETENLPVAEARQVVLFDGDYEIGCGSIATFDEGPVRGMNQFHSGSVRNRTGYANPDMDAAIDTLYRATDEGEVADAMAQLQDVWNEDPPWALIYAGQWFVGWKDDVHGLVPSRDAVVMFQDAYLE
jgi:peptide/nickel transport system substrate-binding protein